MGLVNFGPVGNVRSCVGAECHVTKEYSPVSVGRRLFELLPRAELVVLRGGTHDLVADRAAEIVPYIEKHLAAVSASTPASIDGHFGQP